MRITLNDSDIQQPEPKPVRKRVVKERKPLTRKQKFTRAIFSLIGVICILAISFAGYLIYKAYKTGQAIGFKLTPKDIITQDKPELKRDSTNTYTNALIVGIDTRETGNLLNTDSIILASYNHNTKDVTMLSIPRDFNVQIKPDVIWFSRINAVYATYEGMEEGSGLPRLQDVVTEITGKEIQYYAMIDYNGFTDLIDALGGIDINVENSFTDYMYPAGYGYQTVSFVAGPQTMDGDTALKYARSRHSMHNGEGSDFARARRQQNVISAVVNKVMSGSLLDPKALMNLFNVVQDNIQISEFTISDIEAGVRTLTDFKDNSGEIFSFVLDPNIGSGRLVSTRNMESGAYAIAPTEGLGKYENIQEYLSYMYSDPLLYEQDPKVRVYNTGLGYTDSMTVYTNLKKKFPYLNISYMSTLFNDKEGNTIYLNSEETTYQYSLDAINKFLKADSTQKPEYITSKLNAEDISILLGDTILEEEIDTE